MIGEKAIQAAIVKMVENNPDLIVKIARDGMRIETSSYVNDEGFVVIVAEVKWFNHPIDKAETVLPLKPST